jgi:two-component system OmpR family response regulator
MLPSSLARAVYAKPDERLVNARRAGSEARRADLRLHLAFIWRLDSGGHRMRVLIVEDEPKLAGLLRRGLAREGMAVDVVGDGEEALWRAEATDYDALILDLMLPGIDGLEVCRRLRDAGVWSPILVLTARDAVRDRVAGLESGADDYLTKPFSYAELLARLRALFRRGRSERPIKLRVGDLRLDPATRRVSRRDAEIDLSPKEFAVLETFMRRPGEVLSRFELLEHAWDYDYENRSNVVDAYVRLLRRKIDRPFDVESLETVRGAGYRLREDGGR